MAGLLREIGKLFSLRLAMRSNIMSSNYGIIGTSGVNSMPGSGIKGGNTSVFGSFTASRLVSVWYQKMQELKEYEISDLASTGISIYHDYIFNYFTGSEDIVSLPRKIDSDGEKSRRLNKIIKELDLVNQAKIHLDEISYYGSYCIKIDWDKETRKWIRSELMHPYNVLTVYDSGKLDSHLVQTRDGKLSQQPPYSILRLGKANFRLDNDVINFSDFDGKKKSDSIHEDTILSDYELVAGYPIFYNHLGKVKEYLIKDQMVSILSIKDLIQPLLLLIRVDKQTDPSEANRLALNTENLINKYSDMSAIFGSNFSIMDLMDSILNNIRVLPDYQSTMGDMNSIDLSKITQKIQDIRSDQDNSKENIYTSLGIPRALTAGDTTKWEAIKSSQRLNSRITGLINSITDSFKDIARTLYFLLYKEDINLGDIDIHLFEQTDIDYNKAITNADMAQQYIENINRIVESAQRAVQDSKLMDQKLYLNTVKDQLNTVDPKLNKLIPDSKIDEFIKELESEGQEGGSRGFGGF